MGDLDAIEYMCRAAPNTVIELEHFGVPFSRLGNGSIYQRPFGGQSQNFGGDQAARTCAAVDRTGHAMPCFTHCISKTIEQKLIFLMNCVEVCPKHLNPTKAIGNIKKLMLRNIV